MWLFQPMMPAQTSINNNNNNALQSTISDGANNAYTTTTTAPTSSRVADAPSGISGLLNANDVNNPNIAKPKVPPPESLCTLFTRNSHSSGQCNLLSNNGCTQDQSSSLSSNENSHHQNPSSIYPTDESPNFDVMDVILDHPLNSVCGCHGCSATSFIRKCANPSCQKYCCYLCVHKVYCKFHLATLVDSDAQPANEEVPVCTKLCHKVVQKMVLTGDNARVPWDKDGKNGEDDPFNSS